MFPKRYKYHTVPISEDSTENIAKHFGAAVKWANAAIRRDSANVLFHCMTGNNIGPCFVAAYLIQIHDLTVPEAIKHVRKHRKLANPSQIFIS